MVLFLALHLVAAGQEQQTQHGQFQHGKMHHNGLLQEWTLSLLSSLEFSLAVAGCGICQFVWFRRAIGGNKECPASVAVPTPP
jgi:hypothetical protein